MDNENKSPDQPSVPRFDRRFSQSDTDNEKKSPDQPSLIILSKVSNQISWLTFSLLIIISTNTFLVYQHHFGALKAYDNFLKAAADTKSATRIATKGAPKDINIIIPTGDETVISNLEAYTNDVRKKTNVIILPILGIPLIDRDFVILNFIIAAVFLLWINTLFNYTKSFMENLFNDYYYPSDSDANVIQSLFFLVMPTEYTSKSYAYYECILYFFLVSLALLLGSDIYDIFFEKLSNGKTYFESTHFSAMKWHFVASYLIIAGCVALFVYLLRKLKSNLKHIRNMLLLLRWNRNAFFPVLYEFAEERGNPLIEKKNFVEYRVCDDCSESKLVAILTREKGGTDEIKTAVDLPKSVRKFYSLHKKTNTEYDAKLKRQLTIEESFMRDYFRKILRDKLYEPELYEEFSKLK